MIRISYGARLYALWELSRRAGVTFDWFDRWKITLGPDVLAIRLGLDSPREIRFPFFFKSEADAQQNCPQRMEPGSHQ